MYRQKNVCANAEIWSISHHNCVHARPLVAHGFRLVETQGQLRREWHIQLDPQKRSRLLRPLSGQRIGGSDNKSPQPSSSPGMCFWAKAQQNHKFVGSCAASWKLRTRGRVCSVVWMVVMPTPTSLPGIYRRLVGGRGIGHLPDGAGEVGVAQERTGQADRVKQFRPGYPRS